MNLVLAFLDANHSGSLGAWMAGFVEESVEAYKGIDDSSSCSKGATDREFTESLEKDQQRIKKEAETVATTTSSADNSIP